MKILKVVLINLCLIIAAYFAVDFMAYKYFSKRNFCNSPYFYKNEASMVQFPDRFDTSNTVEYKKPPILLLGCSYTYGLFLDADKNFSTKLSKIAKRQVYNMGQSGAGPNFALAYLAKEENEKTIKHEPEYIIYTYMYHHLDRWDHWRFYNIERENGVIPYIGPKFLYKSWLWKCILDNRFDSQITRQKLYELQIKVFDAIIKKSKQMYPNSKFIFLIYSDAKKNLSLIDLGHGDPNEINEEFDIMYSEKFRKDIENLGVRVITTEELIGRKMDREEDRVPITIDKENYPHPSEKAWDIIVPKLVKKFNL